MSFTTEYRSGFTHTCAIDPTGPIQKFGDTQIKYKFSRGAGGAPPSAAAEKFTVCPQTVEAHWEGAQDGEDAEPKPFALARYDSGNIGVAVPRPCLHGPFGAAPTSRHQLVTSSSATYTNTAFHPKEMRPYARRLLSMIPDDVQATIPGRAAARCLTRLGAFRPCRFWRA
ncbi:hypothetical protein C8R44DRAFT_726173 [Mycena epipterygia]|nr:hypothetical protein C8R44DRAFT_726173 [Mycena epipterygia]